MNINLKKLLKNFSILCFASLLLVGCSNNELTTNTKELNSSTSNFYFDVYTKASENEVRDGVIGLKTLDDSIFFEIRNSGLKRQFSVQMFLDYQQIDFMIEGTMHNTFLFDASGEASEVFEFHLPDSIDTNYNHSLLAILTIDSDIYSSDDATGRHEFYSIPLNYLLSFDENAPFIKSPYDVEETVLASEESAGLLMNSDIENRSRLKPERELYVEKGEEYSMQYQVGGYENCDTVAIITTVGLEQAEINGQPYILCNTENGNLVSGIASYVAPMKPGKYEIMSWVVKNPLSLDKNEFRPLNASVRFTLIVE